MKGSPSYRPCASSVARISPGLFTSTRSPRCSSRFSISSSRQGSATGANVVQSGLGGILAALKCLIRPDIGPVSVPPAVPNAHLVQIAVHRRQRLGTILVEDHVGERSKDHAPMHDLREPSLLRIAEAVHV